MTDVDLSDALRKATVYGLLRVVFVDQPESPFSVPNNAVIRTAEDFRDARPGGSRGAARLVRRTPGSAGLIGRLGGGYPAWAVFPALCAAVPEAIVPAARDANRNV